MKVLLAVFVLTTVLLGTLQAQYVYAPVGTSRQVSYTTTVLIAGKPEGPGILAELDLAKGQAAFDQCMTSGASVVCESVRQAAMTKDAQDRFMSLIVGIYGGDGVATNINVDLLLKTLKLYLIKP